MTKVAVVTGVAGGIGRATAGVFKEAGWRVVGVDRSLAPPLPGVDRFIHADVSEAVDTARIFEEIAQHERFVTALVNNAAIQICKPLVETSAEEWDAVMASNIRSVFLAIRHVVPLMQPRGGAIINVSSVHAIATSAGIAAYAASKGAMLALTRALAIELAPSNIRVNAVLPGAVDTQMLRAGLDRGHLASASIDEKVRLLGARHVMGRVGRPEEIGQAILFLADEERSSFMTGQAMVVDGGATARLSTE